MIIAVAGAYSAPTEEQRQQNLLHLNKAAAALVEKGHTPLIGVNAALPVVQQLNLADPYETIMRIPAVGNHGSIIAIEGPATEGVEKLKSLLQVS